MAGRRKAKSQGGPVCERAAKLLNEKVLDVLERLLEADDDKVQLAAAKEIKEIARQAQAPEPEAQGTASRVFVVTGIDRKPGCE